MSAVEEVVQVGSTRLGKVKRLIDVSHQKPMDLNTVLPWDQAIDKSMYPKRKDHIWIYGTPQCETLNEKQRLELAWLEIGRDISMFIWLEQTIPPLYMGYINTYKDKINAEMTEYLMIFSKEEIVHTMAFKRFMEKAGLAQWKPPVGLFELLSVKLPTMYPAAGIFFTLLIEWIAEIGAMYTTQHDGVEPLARKLFKEHHFDEARHIAFGRWISEWFFENGPAEQVAEVRAMAKEIVPKLIAMYTYNPEIADHTSFPFPIAKDDMETIKSIWHSENNREINNDRLSEYTAWLHKLDIVW